MNLLHPILASIQFRQTVRHPILCKNMKHRDMDINDINISNLPCFTMIYPDLPSFTMIYPDLT